MQRRENGDFSKKILCHFWRKRDKKITFFDIKIEQEIFFQSSLLRLLKILFPRFWDVETHIWTIFLRGDSFWVGSSFSCLVNSVYVTDLNVAHQFQVEGPTVAHYDFYRDRMSLTMFFRALKSDPKNIQVL